MGAKASTSATPRASANLTISFGLVNVPFAMKPLAETKKAVSGKYACPEHGPDLQQRYLCSPGQPNEHLLEASGQITAYQHPDERDRFVVVEKSVLDEIAEERSGSVDVNRIVDARQIDPIWFDKTYLCWPQKGGEEAFDLLAESLRINDRAAVATVVLSKQTVSLILRFSHETGSIVAHTCRFQSDVRWADVDLVVSGAKARPTPSATHMKAAATLLESLEAEFEPEEFVDNYTPMLQDAIRAAADGTTFEAKAPAGESKPTGSLLDALEASVKAAKPKAKTPAKKPASRRKATA